jgi:haloalkane dehalogenase
MEPTLAREQFIQIEDTFMPISAKPYREPRFATVNGRRMAYIDEGVGDTIVFQHGNPTSSYLWRNIMPHCEGLGRLIACDLIGMGRSDKLSDSGPERYSYQEQRDYLFALRDQLNLGDKVIMVLHDWGSLLGFDWTRQHPDRVQGIAYMEAIVQPITWADWPEDARSIFRGFRSKEGETMVLEKNLFVESVLPGAILRRLSEEEMAAYRAPFASAGEDRRPTLTWPRQIPIEGEPPEVVRVATDCGRLLAESRIPKLFINGEPGAILTGRQREFCRTWRNQTEVTVEGIHFVQEDSPDQIGEALAGFIRSLRNP